MAKKRKASAGGSSRKKTPEPTSAKLALNSWEDVADSEDEFHLNRDKILLDEGPEAKRRRKVAEEEALLDDDDFEVLGLPDSSDEEADDLNEEEFYEEEDSRVLRHDQGPASDDEGEVDQTHKEEGLEAWGASHNDYYGADNIETEEAALEEEQEANRVRSKQVEAITDADFDFADPDLINQSTDDGMNVVYNLPNSFSEATPLEPKVAIDASPEERLNYLREKYPVFEALSNEFASLHKVFLKLKNDLNKTGPVSTTKYRVLGTYLGVLAMYFGLFTSTASEQGDSIAKSAEELEKHPIMEEIVALRETWLKIQNLKESQTKQVTETKIIVESQIPSQKLENGTKEKKKVATKVGRKTAEEESAVRRQARLSAIEADLAILDESVQPRKNISRLALRNGESALGDEEALDDDELAEKARRKRNLGFYTSQIVQKASRRGAAGRDAGGDADIPHRERWRDRQARLQAEAEAKRQQEANTVATNGGLRNDSDEDYQTLTARNNAKAEKKEKAREAWEAKEAEKTQLYQEEVGANGKRKLNYQIEMNKGLARSRKKDIRNPRVKKRKKYEEKRKKLSSVRSVYKGGPGRGGYQGELTGIKSGIVRGTRL